MQAVIFFRRRTLVAVCGAGVAISSWGVASVAAAPAADVAVRVEMTDGSVVEGLLEAIDKSQVTLELAAGRREMLLATIRRIGRHPPPGADPLVAALPVEVMGADGARITGDDFLWEGDTAVIVRGAERIELPIDRVKTVAWGARPVEGPAAAERGAWMAAVPAEPAADLVAVSREGGFELVECAITAVSPEVVTVVLDGERIPVKRGKVLGLVWVRPMTAGSGSRVTIAGGSLTAATVEWTAEKLVLDGTVRIPGGLIESIDYAAGRTVSLAALPPATVSAEPFFGALASVDGLATFFAPRLVPAPGAKAADEAGANRSLLMRPRTRAVWLVPADSQRFRAAVVRVAAGQAGGAVRVAVLADDRAVWEQRLDAAAVGGLPIDVDMTAARRLTLVVDFVPGNMGCPVRFDGAVFEK
ncbi:MAG: hypothetical protein WD060_09490 [Pirellulales bacterium]